MGIAVNKIREKKRSLIYSHFYFPFSAVFFEWGKLANDYFNSAKTWEWCQNPTDNTLTRYNSKERLAAQLHAQRVSKCEPFCLIVAWDDIPRFQAHASYFRNQSPLRKSGDLWCNRKHFQAFITEQGKTETPQALWNEIFPESKKSPLERHYRCLWLSRTPGRIQAITPEAGEEPTRTGTLRAGASSFPMTFSR